MKATRTIVCGAVLWVVAGAASALEPRTVQSQSGQFTIRGLPFEALPFSSPTTTNAAYVRLDPAVLAVSCERIKQSLLGVLNMRDQWRGRVQIHLRPVQQDRERIRVTSTRFINGWGYRLEVPEQVETARLFKVIIQVLLLEVANRRASDQSVELPPWLAEGLAAHLEATAAATLALEPESRIVRQERNRDALGAAREILRVRSPLTLNELNWPAPEQFSDQNRELYRSCAHLFVHELLRLKHGRECLQEMLLVLPEYLNWQTAFLGSFRVHFPRLIDADKWWALTLVHFTGRDLFSIWPRQETVRQLDDILNTPIHLRAQAGELPRAGQVKLQTILTEWNWARQSPLLAQKLNHLQALRLRAAPELAGLVDDYLRVLESYWEKRTQLRGEGRFREQSPPSPVLLTRQAVKRLDELELRLDRFRQQPSTAAAAMDSALAESFRRQPASPQPTPATPDAPR